MKGLLDAISKQRFIKEIDKFANRQNEASIKTLSGSLKCASMAAIRRSAEQPILIITPGSKDAGEWHHDLRLMLGEDKPALLSPPDKHLQFIAETKQENYTWLIEALSKLISEPDAIAVVSAEVAGMQLPAPEEVIENRSEIRSGQHIDYEEFIRALAVEGFERKEYVAQEGDLAVRGGIVDIFPVGWNNPLRVEFWGDEIDSIREFNPMSQRSIREHDSVEFLSKLFHSANTKRSASITDYLDDGTICVFDSPGAIENEDIDKNLWEKFRKILINPLGEADINVKSIPQPAFGESVKNLSKELRKIAAYNGNIYLCAEGKVHLSRLNDLVMNAVTMTNGEDDELVLASPQDTLDHITWVPETPACGFFIKDSNFACFTEHQIFGRLRSRDRRKSKSQSGITLRELKQLEIGDYVVHEDKGIGKFDGFETVNMGESQQDCARIIYDEDAILYVHLNYIHKLQKYSAQEGMAPRLSKLGSKEWLRKKKRTKKKLKDIARDLIKLYAQRKTQKGYAFPTDSVWQKELEASFVYEDTPDQARSTDEVKDDMETKTPMDRLVCGDVGFGKTEIAVRAAFKAVQAGKQVAVLVPTTILAQQHYMTLRDRLNRYPVLIDVISRFRSRKRQKEILEKVETGKTDILIGTHRILSKDINFKNLGLLIIDEEHRFGVSAKEKLRQMKVSIDTLTLTATPIPRTLNFSLMGARDLSIIETPPRNRLPVKTEIIEWDNETIIEAIRNETERGGQVFFVNDNIKDIEKILSDLKMLMPRVRFGVAHGQMPPTQLEKVMEKFLEQKFDVLVTTKIIESGIDIPSANTMLINHSQNFGLAELYQLRGRVGRTNIQAYCYLLIPPVHKLPRRALQRLQAIEEFTDLGSGFQLAMRDLEIRGAGNLLGPEQSGFIIDMGFELYQKILEEAVHELRTEEFADIFKDEEIRKKPIFDNEDLNIEIDADAYLPQFYVRSDTERFHYYKKLYQLESNEELQSVIEELRDRYGKLPQEARELIFVVKLRIAALNTGFRRIIIKHSRMVAEFPPDSDDIYYNIYFQSVIEYLQTLPGMKLNQMRKKLMMEIPIENREEAAVILWKIKKTIEMIEAEEAAIEE
jgi:transcription-repair coupling factor (superfamily II helicase)